MVVKYTQTCHIIDGEIYTRREVYRFSIGDADEADIFIGFYVQKWFDEDEKGQFIHRIGKDFVYHTAINENYMGYKVSVTAMIPDRQWTLFQLKYSC